MENELKLKNKPKILGLDVSSKTIGWALFDMTSSMLLEASHFTPKIKPQPEDKIEELLMKAEAFKKHLEKYRDYGIVKVIIEEPLLNSNNSFTVGTLMRYNSMILKECYDVFHVVPAFISTYNARKFAFPDLVRDNGKGKYVLFGGYPKDIDKKHIIWEHVNAVCPEINWIRDKNGNLKKESYDISDSVTCVIGYINMIKKQ
jgi:RNase H-fold protein (predicted Holliday junction resolvase)